MLDRKQMTKSAEFDRGYVGSAEYSVRMKPARGARGEKRIAVARYYPAGEDIGGPTGTTWHEQTEQGLADALASFDRQVAILVAGGCILRAPKAEAAR